MVCSGHAPLADTGAARRQVQWQGPAFRAPGVHVSQRGATMPRPHFLRDHPIAAYALSAVMATALAIATVWQDSAAAAADGLHITEPAALLGG